MVEAFSLGYGPWRLLLIIAKEAFGDKSWLFIDKDTLFDRSVQF